MAKSADWLKMGATILAGLSLALMSTQAFAQMDKGVEFYQLWEFKDAEKAFREELKTNPGNIEANCYLGQSLLMQEKYEEALGILLKMKESLGTAAASSTSHIADPYHLNLSLARAQLGLKQNKEAWESLEAADKAEPNTADVHVFRGVYHMQEQDLKKAARELEKAIDIDKENAYAHYYAGLVYLRQGHPAKAVEVLKMFLQLAPHAPEAFKAETLISGLC